MSKERKFGEKEIAPLSEKPRSVLDIILQELRRNSQVFLAGENRLHHHVSLTGSSRIETSDIFVAPKSPIFDARELNIFMNSLIKGAEPTSVDLASESSGGGLHFGKLYFDEVIGSVHVATIATIETSEPDTLERAGGVLGETRIDTTHKLERRSWLRVYPDPISAATIHDYEVGRSKGTVEFNPAYDYAEYWLDRQEILTLKQMYKNDPQAVVRALLGK